jgi:hypothetical protein
VQVEIAVEITLVHVKNTLERFEITPVHVVIADLFSTFLEGGAGNYLHKSP